MPNSTRTLRQSVSGQTLARRCQTEKALARKNLASASRRQKIARASAATLGAFILAGGVGQMTAQGITTQYFDVNGATAGSGIVTGGTYTWDTTTLNWTSDSTGASPTVAYNNGATTTSTSAEFAAGTDANGASYTVDVAPALFVHHVDLINTGTLTLVGTGSLQFQDSYGGSYDKGVTVAAGGDLILNGFQLYAGSGGGSTPYIYFGNSGSATGTTFLGTGISIATVPGDGAPIVVPDSGALDIGAAGNFANVRFQLQGPTGTNATNTLEAYGTFNRTLGTGAGQLAFYTVNGSQDAGGFSAYNANAANATLNVNLNNNNSAITYLTSYGGVNFLGNTGGELVFGSQTSDGQVIFNNGLNFNAGTAEFNVLTNTSALNTATSNFNSTYGDYNGNIAQLTGQLTNGGISILGPGTLVMTNPNNSYSGATNLNNGRLFLSGGLTGGTAIGVAANSALIESSTGNISGVTSLAINGGSVTLAGSNTFTGGTTLSSGTLSGTTNSLPGNITNNSTVIFDQTLPSSYGGASIASGTFAGVISGSGALVQNNAGMVTLTGVNTYTGTTSVNGGVLNLANAAGNTIASTGAFTVGGAGSAATLLVSGNQTIGGPLTIAGDNGQGSLSLSDGTINTLTLNSGLTLGGATTPSVLSFDLNTTGSSDLISLGAGSLTLNTAGAHVTLSEIGSGAFATGSYTLLNFGSENGAGSITFSRGTDTLASNGQILTLSTTATSEILTVTNGAAVPATAYFQGGQDASWATLNGGTISNFTTDAAGTTNTMQVPGSTTNVHFYASNANPANVAASTLDQPFTINSLTIDGGALSSPVSIAPGAGGAASTLTILAGTSGGNAAGSGILINSGAGAVTISAPLVVGATQSWTNNAASPFTLSGGVNTNGVGLTIAGTGSTSLTGNITGGGSLTTTGPVFLSGANSYSGGTTVSAGTLTGNTSSLQGSIADNAAVIFNQSTSGNFAGAITGAGSVEIAGTATTSFTGTANAYTGGTTVDSGATLGGGGATLTGNITDNGAVAFNVAGGGTFTGNITGSGSLLATAGTTYLSGANSYTGGTTISASATLAGTTSSITGDVLDNGNLTFNQASDGTYSGAISGVGAVAVNGTANVTLAGNDSYTGGTSVNGGTLTGTTSSLVGNISNTSNLVFNQTTTGTYTGTISGTGALFNNGSGTVTLGGTAANTNTGLTTVNAGTLVLGKTGASSTAGIGVNAINGSLLINSGAAVQLGGSGGDQIDNGATVTVNGTLDLNGSTGISNPNKTATSTYTQAGLGERFNVLLGSGTILNNAAGTSAAISFGTGGNPSNFTGIIEDGAGTTGITLNNAATLSGQNTYTGPTNIVYGLTLVGAEGTATSGAFGNGSAVNVGTGGGANGISLNGYDVTLGSLSSTVVLGSGILNQGGEVLFFDPSILTVGGNNLSTTFAGNLTNGGFGGGTFVKVGSGTLTISGTSNDYQGSTTVSGGVLDITGSLAGTGTVTVDATNAPATLILDSANAISATTPITGIGPNAFVPTININASQTLASINSVGATNFTAGTSVIGPIDGTGTTSLTNSNVTAMYVRQGVLNVGSLSTLTTADSPNPGTTTATSVLTDLNNSGTVDLNNNDLIVNDSAQFSTIQAQIASAYDGAAWDKPGLTSSSARANPATYGLGYATPAEIATDTGSAAPTTFDGQPVSSGSVLVKYTLLGDTTLKGSVGVGDLLTVKSYLGTPNTDWSQGNFHYSGTTSVSDLLDVKSNLGAMAMGSSLPGSSIGGAMIVRSSVARTSISPSIVNNDIVRNNMITPPLIAPSLVSHSMVRNSLSIQSSAIAAQNDLHLQINTSTGDVSLVNAASTPTAFTAYEINVNDNSPNVLNIGNPKPDSTNVISSGSGNPPYTNEMPLSETDTTSPNYNTSAAALGNNPALWELDQDGFNSNGSGFGLTEAPVTFVATPTGKQKSNAVTIPVGGSIDLGKVFDNLAPQNDLTFTFAPTDAAGGDTTTTYTAPIDYISAPEPASLGLLAFAGLGLFARRRRAATPARDAV